MKLCLFFILLIVTHLRAQTILPVEQHKRLDSVFQVSDLSILIDSNSTLFETDNVRKVIKISPVLVSDFMKEYNLTDSALVTHGILAHEYGHIKQQIMGFNLSNDSTLLFKELHADLMAGFYLSNLYRSSFMNWQATQSQIVEQICYFFKDKQRHPNLYLLISMLVNSEYDFNYDSQLFGGNSPETVKMMRLTAFWEGIRTSGSTSINHVYSYGQEYIRRLITNKNSIDTFKAFEVVSLNEVNNILRGKYDYKGSIDAIRNRVRQSNRISTPKKIGYEVYLRAIRSGCQ